MALFGISRRNHTHFPAAPRESLSRHRAADIACAAIFSTPCFDNGHYKPLSFRSLKSQAMVLSIIGE
jgi:hypothetical protein